MSHKRIIVIIAIVSLVFALVGCGAASTTGDSTGGASAEQGAQWANVELNEATILAIGTIGLDGTQNEVTAGQASTLITLWEAYTALAYDDTTAQAELDAVVSGITSAMTQDQIAAIDGLNITADSIPTILETAMGGRMQPRTTGTPGINDLDPSMMGSSGVPGGEGGGMPNFDPGSMPGGGFNGAPGGDAGGGFPGMGDAIGGGDMGSVMGNPNGESTIDPSLQATQQAMAQTQMMNTQVFNMVIQYLHQIAGEQ